MFLRNKYLVILCTSFACAKWRRPLRGSSWKLLELTTVSRFLAYVSACRNLSICSNVQITKYLDVPNLRQISSKSRILWFFCQNLEEKLPCPDRLFFVQISFLLRFCQISKYAPSIAIHFWLGWWADEIGVSNPVARHILRKIEPWNIIAPYFSSRFCQNKHLFAKKRQFGRIWKKNNYGMKLREALPNRRQIRSK